MKFMELKVVRQPNKDMSCSTCSNWLPHVHYPLIGYCTLWIITTFDDYYCSEYTKMNVEADRFYWCASCKVRLTREEARKHWTLEHRVMMGAYVDPDVREEIYES